MEAQAVRDRQSEMSFVAPERAEGSGNSAGEIVPPVISR